MTRYTYSKDFKIWLYEGQDSKQIDYYIKGRVIFKTNDEEHLTENITFDSEVYEITPYIFITEDYYVPMLSDSKDHYFDLQFKVFIESEVKGYFNKLLISRKLELNFDDERRYL